MDSKSQKLFFVGRGRDTSLDDAAIKLLSSAKEPPSKQAANSSTDCSGSKLNEQRRCRLSGSGICKLSVIFYLVTCVLISALYVAFFGKSQSLFGDAWIPGKPTFHDSSIPMGPYFQDLPYTEWISQRWTYHETPFANWPTLPPEILEIQQILAGKIGSSDGLWLLSYSELYFVHGLNGSVPTDVVFLNISEELDLEITPNSYIFSTFSSTLYVITSQNITYLDCSSLECEITHSSWDPLPFDKVLTSTFSLSDHTLWLGTTQGLFAVSMNSRDDTYEYDDTTGFFFTGISEVVEPVLTLAWRSAVTNREHFKFPYLRPFFYTAKVTNSLQENFASSNRYGLQWTGSYYLQKHHVEFGVLVAGTVDKVYFYDGRQWWFEWASVWNDGLGGVIDGTPTALTFGPCGELYIANNVSLTRVNINYTFDRIGPLDGLPYNQLTSLLMSPYVPRDPPPNGMATYPNLLGTLWIGTAKGYTLFDVQSSKFRGYFYGPRWLPGGSILSMVQNGAGIVILTEVGLAVIYPEEWTLEKKAKHYQTMLSRHIREPGLVSDCPVANFTESTCSPRSTDNDGLWTAWLVAAEAFRYQVTRDQTARANSWALFKGLQFLVNVTDVEGLMARSVVTVDSMVDGPTWHTSTSIPGWRWKGDTSSDEVVGHMFAYPIVYDLVAKEDGEKKEVEELLVDIVGYIKSNQFTLIDITNHSTRWGVWTPNQLNLNQSWADERGLNSLQILSFLLSAYRITNDNQFLTAWKELFSGMYEDAPAHYGMNIINQKITFPRDNNFSDDELSLLTYFLYFYSIKKMDSGQLMELGTLAKETAGLSLQRTWRAIERERSSAWNAIIGTIADNLRSEPLLEDLVWNLRTWPLELIEWSTFNSHRLDIRINPEQDRNMQSGKESVNVLPANERTQLRWNENPFLLDTFGSSSEMDPGPWLLPYWLARWSGIL